MTIGTLFNLAITDINGILVPVLFAVAFIVFIYGVFNYFILGGADEAKRSTGRTYIVYGLIGFVIMFSLWGIVNVLTNSLQLGGSGQPPLPTFNQ